MKIDRVLELIDAEHERIIHENNEGSDVAQVCAMAQVKALTHLKRLILEELVDEN